MTLTPTQLETIQRLKDSPDNTLYRLQLSQRTYWTVKGVVIEASPADVIGKPAWSVSGEDMRILENAGILAPIPPSEATPYEQDLAKRPRILRQEIIDNIHRDLDFTTLPGRIITRTPTRPDDGEE